MAAKFRVRRVEALFERRQYLLRGEVIEGTVHVGMTLEIALNSSLSVTASIVCVGTTSERGRSDTEVIVQCDSSGELETLLALNVGEGEILEVTES